jgi:SPOR domain
MKWIFALLLLASVALFAFMQLGGMPNDANLQPQPEINTEKIRLLNAPGAAASTVAASMVAASSVPASAPAVAQAAPACMEWGELFGDELKRATDALKQLKPGDKLGVRRVERTVGFWVYIPPQRNRAEVNRRIEELKQSGVTEYFVMQNEGKWHNAISLGLFKTEEAAHHFLASVEARGVKSAKLGPRAGKLSATVFEFREPDANLAAKVTALARDFPDSELKATACAHAAH